MNLVLEVGDWDLGLRFCKVTFQRVGMVQRQCLLELFSQITNRLLMVMHDVYIVHPSRFILYYFSTHMNEIFQSKIKVAYST